MTNKQIVEAQKLLRKLDGTPVKVYNEQGDVYWQVTYDNSTYSSLINIIETVSKLPIKEYATYPQPTYPSYAQPASNPIEYHREKIE